MFCLFVCVFVRLCLSSIVLSVFAYLFLSSLSVYVLFACLLLGFHLLTTDFSFPGLSCLFKAPALDCVEEAKAAAKKDSCRTLHCIAKARVESADEPLFNALDRSGLAMRFRRVSLKLDDDLSYPCFPPKEQLEAIAADGFFHKVLGMPVAYSDTVLPRFWDKYRSIYPDHDIFHRQQDFAHLIPYYLHGDGGRTYKKDSIMILSMFSAFGEGTARNPVELQPTPGNCRKRPHPHGATDFEPGVNLRGNTLASRFLFTAMKCDLYKKKKQRFQTLVDQWGQYLGDLYHNGFNFNGEVWKVAILGMTGDAPFLREVGNFNRSFSNVQKSARSRARLPGVCWLCEAGKTDGPPFEDPRITMAAWTRTCGLNNPAPWVEPGALLQYVPVTDNDIASFYKPDLFHVYHAGIGKDFTGSALIYVAKSIFRRSRLQLSIDDMNAELKQYLRTSGEKMNFANFTLELLGYGSSRTYPKGHWSKNMDTATVSKFIEHVCCKHVFDFPDDRCIGLIIDACGAIHQFMRVVFSAAYFLTEEESWQLISSGHAFLSCYTGLAQETFNSGLCLFGLKPVLHLFAHIVHSALQQFKRNSSGVVNPISEATFMSEDLVGRVSRLSRRVSAKQHGHKIMSRVMVAMHYHLHHPAGLEF